MFKKGYKQTAQHKTAIGRRLAGRTQTKEHKEKNRQAHLGYKNSNWIDGRDWYKTIHSYIIRYKGKASNHKCIDCSKQAFDWSNIDHMYSNNLNDYQPRCRSCHVIFDKQLNN